MADVLADFVHTVYTIECADCEVVEETSDADSELEATKLFETLGWRVINGVSVCAGCAKTLPPD